MPEIKKKPQARPSVTKPTPTAAPVHTAAPVPTSPPPRPVMYDKVITIEYSSTSEHGPMTVEDTKVMLGWETEKHYQERMVKEKGGKPEHYLFGESVVGNDGVVRPIHCVDTDKQKVVCWNNANNRPFDMMWCEDLVHTILYGQWAGPLMMPGETVNGETVRVSRTGRVLSGQHQATALILANEWLQKSRAVAGNVLDPKYPAWNGHDEPVIETIVVFGLSEDERVLRTIDYVKPRTTADMLYTMELFRQNTPVERKEMTKMLASALDLLWTRTATKGYQTHPEVVGFLGRHRRLLECVGHIFIENSAKGADGGRKISKLRVSPGHAAALCYLMGCGSEETTEYSDEYRNESPPSEKNLDWSYWDQAQDFWACLASSRDFIPVRTALNRLVDSSVENDDNTGLGGRAPEKLAILAKAWQRYRDHKPSAGPAFDNGDLTPPDGALCLTYTSIDNKGEPLPVGRIDLVDVADFYGIDCPRQGVANDPFRGQPDPPAPVGDDYERLKEEARARRTKHDTRTGHGRPALNLHPGCLQYRTPLRS